MAGTRGNKMSVKPRSMKREFSIHEMAEALGQVLVGWGRAVMRFAEGMLKSADDLPG